MKAIRLFDFENQQNHTHTHTHQTKPCQLLHLFHTTRAYCQMTSFEQCGECEAQLAEGEIMEAAYGSSFQLHVDATQTLDIAFDITTKEISIRFYVPPNFPNVPIRFILNSAHALNNGDRMQISMVLQTAINEADDHCALGSMEICQMAIDLSRECVETNAKAKKSSSADLITHCKKRIARFLIYFHHIMSGKKRVAIVQEARELGLGGFSKHGFPGIVIVEGFDYNVLEYVRRIQHLRWQQMVVRGEEFDDYMEETNENCFERKFPVPFREIDGDSMSDIATLCQEANCHELFMTSMKKY